MYVYLILTVYFKIVLQTFWLFCSATYIMIVIVHIKMHWTLQFRPYIVPANFFWDISVRFLSWECWDFWRWHDHFRRFPKKSEVFRRSPTSSEDVRRLPKTSKVCRRRSYRENSRSWGTGICHLIFILNMVFVPYNGSELTYFWKLCQARRQQLTFFNQAWEIGPQAWAGMRLKFSTRRRRLMPKAWDQSWQV